MFRKLLFVLFGSIFLSGCTTQGSLTKETAGQATTQEVSITIQNFKFFPDTITVIPGQVIRVVNKDTAPHTVTSSDGKSFDSGILNKDQTGTITAPETVGAYPYICTIHPSMKGTLIVK